MHFNFITAFNYLNAFRIYGFISWTSYDCRTLVCFGIRRKPRYMKCTRDSWHVYFINVRSCYNQVTWNAHPHLEIRYHNYVMGIVPIVTMVCYSARKANYECLWLNYFYVWDYCKAMNYGVVMKECGKLVMEGWTIKKILAQTNSNQYLKFQSLTLSASKSQPYSLLIFI